MICLRNFANFCCNVGILIGRSRFYSPSNSLLSLYYTLIYPYLTYYNLVWASTYVSNLQRIYLLHKRAVRSITKADYKAPSKPFTKLNILDIFSIYSLQVGTFMYRYHNLLPLSFCQTFQTSNQLHRHSTRYSDFYQTHLCRTNTKKFSLLFQGPKIWNSLPIHIEATTSAPSFKQLMKSFLRDRQNEFNS